MREAVLPLACSAVRTYSDIKSGDGYFKSAGVVRCTRKEFDAFEVANQLSYDCYIEVLLHEDGCSTPPDDVETVLSTVMIAPPLP